MPDNEKAIIDNLTRAVADANYYRAQIDTLRNLVDNADIDKARDGFGDTITTERLRAIFGWPLCEIARDIILEKESLAIGRENA